MRGPAGAQCYAGSGDGRRGQTGRERTGLRHNPCPPQWKARPAHMKPTESKGRDVPPAPPGVRLEGPGSWMRGVLPALRAVWESPKPSGFRFLVCKRTERWIPSPQRSFLAVKMGSEAKLKDRPGNTYFHRHVRKWVLFLCRGAFKNP